MFSDFTKHTSHYLSLIGVIAVSLIGFVYFQYDKSFQAAICISAGLSYITWGIVHHYIHDDLNTWIAFEYISSAALGVILLLYVIWS